MRNILRTALLAITLMAPNMAHADSVVTKRLDNGITMTYFNNCQADAMDTTWQDANGNTLACVADPQTSADKQYVPSQNYYQKQAQTYNTNKNNAAQQAQQRQAAEGAKIDCNDENAILNYMSGHNGKAPNYCAGLQYWSPIHNAAIKYKGGQVAPMSNFVPQ